jgi:Na+/H+ antiporter NhaD/arsenite permease-like protein
METSLWIAPFGLLLAAIALGPLLFPEWWGRHYAKVALGLGALTLIACVVKGIAGAVEVTPNGAGFSVLMHHFLTAPSQERLMHTGIEYVSFICLIGSLFVISGGIHINVKGEATPATNVLYLLIGALVSNVLGTTGAAMLLIRPWLRMNKYRLTAHHVVFFIFIVANVGGCLTPVGDPPLFLGYLNGVPFWWVAEHCWSAWLVGVGTLLAIFYALDRLNFSRAPKQVREVETAHEQWRFQGLANLLFLGVVLGAVFINRPLFLREAIMVLASAASYYTTQRSVHDANDFNFHPIKEVIILFAGIFATMIPALEWLETSASRFGHPTPTLFFWASGSLSSVLDNAPTYFSFLSAQIGALAKPETAAAVLAYLKLHGPNLGAVASSPYSAEICQAVAALKKYHPNELMGAGLTLEHVKMALVLAHPIDLKAISIASVFFGANTYIGNGPNFLVKSIAEHQKARIPGFIGYIVKFTLPFLAPTLLITWWLFFR